MQPLIEFERVVYAAEGSESLEEISFSLDPGENAVFFGVEGSGLRTIPRLIIGLEEEYEGSIRWKGLPIRGLDYLARLRYKNEIGYLHGDYGLISNLTVAQNISQRLEYFFDYSQDRIRDITEKLMAELRISDMSGARPVELASSQILRTAYARAVVHDPDLLIVEHAFVNQSPLDTRSFMDVLGRRTESPDKSVIFITYDPQKFVDFANLFIMLYKGRIVFSGDGKEFAESDNPYLAQYRNVSLQGPMDIQ